MNLSIKKAAEHHLTIKIRFILFFLFLLLLSTKLTFARSGCCSHHGGVCGCGCCDGTSLSSICAPYYPQCNSGPVYTPQPWTPEPTTFPTLVPTPSPESIELNSQTDSSGAGFGQLIILGGLIYLVFWIIKKLLKREKDTNG